MTDWRAWHGDYEDPTSSLSRRLAVVRERLRELLTSEQVGSVLSLCAGDARDVVPVVAELPLERRPRVTVVELDSRLAEGARQRAEAAGVQIAVIEGDAGRSEHWSAALPVDLLMLCGIFGNITVEDVQATIRASRGMLSPAGSVVWTRGGDPALDLRPQVRQWWDEEGFEELSFDAEDHGYGVGVHRLRPTQPERSSTPLPDQLFTFVK